MVIWEKSVLSQLLITGQSSRHCQRGTIPVLSVVRHWEFQCVCRDVLETHSRHAVVQRCHVIVLQHQHLLQISFCSILQIKSFCTCFADSVITHSVLQIDHSHSFANVSFAKCLQFCKFCTISKYGISQKKVSRFSISQSFADILFVQQVLQSNQGFAMGSWPWQSPPKDLPRRLQATKAQVARTIPDRESPSSKNSSYESSS